MTRFKLPDPSEGMPAWRPHLTGEERAAMRRRTEERNRNRPCYGQSRDSIKAWMKKHARVGLIIVIRSTISSDPLGEYDYILDEITELNPRRGSFYTATPTTWYSTDRGSWYYTGQSTDTPTGKIDLCMPTPALVRAAIQQETGFLPREHHRTLVERAREQSIALFAADPLA